MNHFLFPFAFPTTSDHSGKSSSQPLREAPDHEVQSAALARHDFIYERYYCHYFYKNFKRQGRPWIVFMDGPVPSICGKMCFAGLFHHNSQDTFLIVLPWRSRGPNSHTDICSGYMRNVWTLQAGWEIGDWHKVWTNSVVCRVNNWRLETSSDTNDLRQRHQCLMSKKVFLSHKIPASEKDNIAVC